jgi:uncharacterized membrane protein
VGSEPLAPSQEPPATSTGLDPKLEVLLSYLGWWITGLVFLAVEHQHAAVRFHAAQSLVLFGALSLLMFGLSGVALVSFVAAAPVAGQALADLNKMVWLLAAVLWVVLVLKAIRGESWRVPGIAPLADRLAARA